MYYYFINKPKHTYEIQNMLIYQNTNKKACRNVVCKHVTTTHTSPPRSLWLTIFQSNTLWISFAGSSANIVKFQCWHETTNEMGVKSGKNNPVHSICQTRPWQHTSALRWQHREQQGSPFHGYQSLSPRCVVWPDTHCFDFRPQFPLRIEVTGRNIPVIAQHRSVFLIWFSSGFPPKIRSSSVENHNITLMHVDREEHSFLVLFNYQHCL